MFLTEDYIQQNIMLESSLSLSQFIKNHIRLEGPISLARYMDYCLLHPQFGYYTQGKAIGADGDFITAPEISQCFGEMVGLWCLDLIKQMLTLRPDTPIHLIELGPGRGVLMKDILRVLTINNIAPSRLQITLVEASPEFKKTQYDALHDSSHAYQEQIDWQPNLDFPLQGTPLYVANEFFDALPIHQFMFTEKGVDEICIALNEKDEFCYIQYPLEPENHDIILTLLDKIKERKQQKQNQGQDQDDSSFIIETSPISEAIIAQMADKIAQKGGGALVIDYGYAGLPPEGGSFQAVHNHNYGNPLEHQGQQDLTAHVDFSALYKAAQPYDIALYPLLHQSDFLYAEGINYRMEELIRLHPQKKESIISGVERLTHEKQMGQLFKVMQMSEKKLLPSLFEQANEG